MIKIIYRNPNVLGIWSVPSNLKVENFMRAIVIPDFKDFVLISLDVVLPGPLDNGRKRNKILTGKYQEIGYPLITIQNEIGEIIAVYGLKKNLKASVNESEESRNNA